MKVAINGFGRIGRQIFRINHEKKAFEIVAINDTSDAKTMAHLLKYDSTYGTMKADIEVRSEDEMVVDGKSYKLFTERDPEKLPWKDLEVDVVIEATGAFRTRELASKHLTSGAKKVILTAPAKDEIDFTTVVGVNEEDYDPANHHIISNASCTTNCLAPFAKVLNDELGIVKGLMTTIHAYTTSQTVLDVGGKDLRRSRAAALSMIPTTTGAAKAVGIVLPELEGKLNGLAIRIPTPTVSMVDLTFESEKETSAKEVNAILKTAADGRLKGILCYSEEPLVSIDYKGTDQSSTIDALSTMVIDGNLVKVMSWYDNEWGYSARTVDLAKMVGEKM